MIEVELEKPAFSNYVVLVVSLTIWCHKITPGTISQIYPLGLLKVHYFFNAEVTPRSNFNSDNWTLFPYTRELSITSKLLQLLLLWVSSITITITITLFSIYYNYYYYYMGIYYHYNYYYFYSDY